METVIARWRETYVPVPEAIPLHVMYLTAWVDATDTIQFRPDPYGHDALLEAILDAH